MNEIIERVSESIQKLISSRSLDEDDIETLNDIPSFLEAIRDSDGELNGDWIRLFVRHLNRFLTNNDLIPFEIWTQWWEDIHSIIYTNAGVDHPPEMTKKLLETIQYEEKLEEREEKLGQRKSFDDRQDLLADYLESCLLFHSKIAIETSIENLDEFLSKFSRTCNASLSPEKRVDLLQKLSSISIDYHCSEQQPFKSLPDVNNRHVNLNNFFPSLEQTKLFCEHQSKSFEETFEDDRWIVILGDPGCSKTTLLRWLTSSLTKRVLSSEKNVRVPILIRMDELAQWFVANPSETILDYIGRHTWFSERYCDDQQAKILRELVIHGHTLILFDGLDDIINYEQREPILTLLRTFLDEHVRSPEFVSPFDQPLFPPNEMLFQKKKIVEVSPSNARGGNQVVLTSRVVGYQFCSISGSSIKHYQLSLMSTCQIFDFAERWMKSVRESLEKIFIGEDVEEFINAHRTSITESIYGLTKVELLLSNPRFFSLICTDVLFSSPKYSPRSPGDLYDYAVHALSNSWTKVRSLSFQEILIDVQVNLSLYLSFHSSSGLIDAFDAEQLCRWTLKQRGVSGDVSRLRQLSREILSFLVSTTTMFIGEGLDVYGFSYSFQEYFTALSFVRNSPIEEIVKGILSTVAKPGFRRSFSLIKDWIQSHRSSDDYQHFFRLLLLSTKGNSIPFGVLIFLDNFSRLKVSLSVSFLYEIVTSLFDHRSSIVRSKYLFPLLWQLSTDQIIEWMDANLIDDKSLLRFCQCFPEVDRRNVVYQHVWSLNKTNNSLIEFSIDQVLRRSLLISDDRSQVFNSKLASYLQVDIHPLILSLIMCVCGGYQAVCEGIPMFLFLPRWMHRESSVLPPIFDYLENSDQCHFDRLNLLVTHYENLLAECSPMSISTDIVDTFIALICLRGLSHPLIYLRYESYQALPLALERFEQIWFYLSHDTDGNRYTKSPLFTHLDVEVLIKEYLEQSNRSDLEVKQFLYACADALNKYHCCDIEESIEICKLNPDEYYFPYQDNAIDFSISQEDPPLFLLIFIQRSLQPLYHHTILSTESLPFVVLLIECLIKLDIKYQTDSRIQRVLPMLKPILTEYQLENYALIIFYEKYFDDKWFIDQWKTRYISNKSLRQLVGIERQRIANAMHRNQDLQLFTSSICLARLFQFQTRFQKCGQSSNELFLSLIHSEEIHSIVIKIEDPVIQLICWNIIFDMRQPLIFHLDQRDQLRYEVLLRFQNQLSNFPLLISTFLFIQCQRSLELFPDLFQSLSNLIGEKLNEKENLNDQQIALLALQQCNNVYLSPHLAQFARRTNNISRIFHFHSRIFANYLHETTSFQSESNSRLSFLYLIELTFDVQHLQIKPKTRKVFPNHSNLLTTDMATWITNQLTNPTEQMIANSIEYPSECLFIQSDAYLVMRKWIQYQTNSQLNFFAQYAAFELLLRGEEIPHFFEMIKPLFEKSDLTYLINRIPRLFHCPSINLNILKLVLIEIQGNLHLSSKISLRIVHREMFELIFNLEKERIDLNQSYIFLIQDYSLKHQSFLQEYFHRLTIENHIQLISNLVRWFIRQLQTFHSTNRSALKLYEDIFQLLHDHRFPQIQKSIAHALEWRFCCRYREEEQDLSNKVGLIINLERVVLAWKDYHEETLANCLLAYGNYLLKTKKFQKKIPTNFVKALTQICEETVPRIISIRAYFCLCFMYNRYFLFKHICEHFEDRWELTPESEYRLIIQRMFYSSESFTYPNEKLVDSILIDPDWMKLFVAEFYTSLCNENKFSDSFHQSHVYCKILDQANEEISTRFVRTVRQTLNIEDQLKRELYLYFRKSFPKYSKESIRIYARFRILTIEFLQMVQWCETSDIYSFYLDGFTDVYDRNTIEVLLEKLKLKRCEPVLKFYLRILRCLAKRNLVSLSEIHANLPLVDDQDLPKDIEKEIFYFLLEISSFNDQRNPLESDRVFITTDRVTESFVIEQESFQ